MQTIYDLIESGEYTELDNDDLNDLFNPDCVTNAINNKIVLVYNTDSFVAYVIYKDGIWYCNLHQYHSMYEFKSRKITTIISRCNKF